MVHEQPDKLIISRTLSYTHNSREKRRHKRQPTHTMTHKYTHKYMCLQTTSNTHYVISRC